MDPLAPPRLKLVRPALPWREPFREMVAAFQQAGETYYERCLHLIQTDFSAYLGHLQRMEDGRQLPPGRVPQSEFWLLEAGQARILGAIRFRHALTPTLENLGGHIGYHIRPDERRKGYGRRMLSLLLTALRDSGWQRVLVTCDASNLGSIGVIEANGGQLEDQRPNGPKGELVNRYWIALC